jgi:hypothetical protein
LTSAVFSRIPVASRARSSKVSSIISVVLMHMIMHCLIPTYTLVLC